MVEVALEKQGDVDGGSWRTKAVDDCALNSYGHALIVPSRSQQEFSSFAPIFVPLFTESSSLAFRSYLASELPHFELDIGTGSFTEVILNAVSAISHPSASLATVDKSGVACGKESRPGASQFWTSGLSRPSWLEEASVGGLRLGPPKSCFKFRWGFH